MVSEKTKNRMNSFERRIDKLEAVAHPPVNWQHKIESLEGAFTRLYDLVNDLIKEK